MEEEEDDDDDPLVLEPYPIYLSMSSKIMNKRKTIYLAFPLPPPLLYMVAGSSVLLQQ